MPRWGTKAVSLAPFWLAVVGTFVVCLTAAAIFTGFMASLLCVSGASIRLHKDEQSQPFNNHCCTNNPQHSTAQHGAATHPSLPRLCAGLAGCCPVSWWSCGWLGRHLLFSSSSEQTAIRHCHLMMALGWNYFMKIKPKSIHFFKHLIEAKIWHLEKQLKLIRKGTKKVSIFVSQLCCKKSFDYHSNIYTYKQIEYILYIFTIILQVLFQIVVLYWYAELWK